MDERGARKRRQRALLLTLVAGALIAFVAGAVGCVGRRGFLLRLGGARRHSARAPGLPRGGRRIFPEFRVVAYYGAPQNRELGALGIGTPDEAGRRLARAARPYGKRTRPALPRWS